jgi:xanthine/uracil permease
MLSLFFLFDLKKDRPIIIGHLIAIIGLILIHYFTNRSLFSSQIVTQEMRARLLIANIALSAMSILYFIVLAIKSKVKR